MDKPWYESVTIIGGAILAGGQFLKGVPGWEETGRLIEAVGTLLTIIGGRRILGVCLFGQPATLPLPAEEKKT